MALTSSIGNVLTIIRNGCRAHHESVDVPSSNMAKAVVEVLKQEGFIENYRYSDDGKQGTLRIYLRYLNNKEPVISNVKLISKPGLKVYVTRQTIPSVLRGRGTAIISTSKGIITDKQAKELGIGGEVICYVW